MPSIATLLLTPASRSNRGVRLAAMPKGAPTVACQSCAHAWDIEVQILYTALSAPDTSAPSEE